VDPGSRRALAEGRFRRTRLVSEPAVKRWLAGVGMDHTRYGYLLVLDSFLQISALSVEELLALADQDRGYGALDRVQEYVRSVKGRVRNKEFQFSALKSFFAHNRKALPKDPSFKVVSDIPPVTPTLNANLLHRIYEAAGLRERSWIAVAATTLAGEKELCQISAKGYEITRQIRRGRKLIRVDYAKLRKRSRQPYYAVLQGPAITAIREYLDKKRGEVRPGEPLWRTSLGNPFKPHAFHIGWRAILIRLNIRPNRAESRGKPTSTRYGDSVHEIRDVSRSAWTQSPANPIVAEFLMGHTVDPNQYNKFYLDFEWVAKEHAKALPFIDPSGETLTDQQDHIREMEERLAKLEAVYSEKLKIKER